MTAKEKTIIKAALLECIYNYGHRPYCLMANDLPYNTVWYEIYWHGKRIAKQDIEVE